MPNPWDAGQSWLKCYTYSDSEKIPDSPGIYAWYLPLYMRSDYSLDDFFEKYSTVLSAGNDPVQAEAQAQWETLDIVIQKKTRDCSPRMKALWEKLAKSPVAVRKAFTDTLLRASTLLPPLYVGKADNLSRRYHQHVNAQTSADINSFHSRFREVTNDLEFPVEFRGLIFCCTPIEKEFSSLLNFEDSELEGQADSQGDSYSWLLEQMLLRFCNPTFSLR